MGNKISDNDEDGNYRMILLRHAKTLLFISFVLTLFLLCAACSSSGETSQSTMSERTVESETESASQTANNSIPETETEPEAVSSAESNCNNAGDAVLLNPETPVTTSSQENELIEAGNEWQEMFGCATAMESYLRSVLSDSEHGGISIFTGTLGDTLEETANDTDAGIPRLIIYAISKDALNKAIQSYTGKQCKVIIKDARWSLKDMNNFKQILEKMELHSGQSLDITISEDYNNIKVDASNVDDMVKHEINTLIQANNIPSSCVFILNFDETSISLSLENPVT